MSKAGRKCRRWHYRRIEQEFDRKPEELICEMFELGTALTVIAGALGISYGEVHEWIRELGLRREPIARANCHAVKRRLREEHSHDAVSLICSERASGMSYHEIRERYGVSQGFIADCLHDGAPWLIGTHIAPVTIRPPRLSNEERAIRSERCKRHNAIMKKEGRGWFA